MNSFLSIGQMRFRLASFAIWDDAKVRTGFRARMKSPETISQGVGASPDKLELNRRDGLYYANALFSA
jgi:hypothetical protein